jgi:hypothetical protein
MTVAAFGFGVLIFLVSLFFLLGYIRSQTSLRRGHNSLVRQREQQLKLQVDLQARIEADVRKFEAERRALLERAGGDSERSNVGHAA